MFSSINDSGRNIATASAASRAGGIDMVMKPCRRIHARDALDDTSPT